MVYVSTEKKQENSQNSSNYIYISMCTEYLKWIQLMSHWIHFNPFLHPTPNHKIERIENTLTLEVNNIGTETNEHILMFNIDWLFTFKHVLTLVYTRTETAKK